MAEGTLTLPEYVAKLAGRLRQELTGSEVSYEQVRADRYRFVVVWDRFEGTGHPDHQRIVWHIVDETVEKSDLLKVAMIVTLAPSEVQGD